MEDKAMDPLLVEFLNTVKSKSYSGSYRLAEKTVVLLRELITRRTWSTAKDLIALIKSAGRVIESNQPAEAVIGNMVRRILRLVRESYAQCGEAPPLNVTLIDYVATPEKSTDKGDYNIVYKNLKGNIIQSINDLLEELEISAHNIAAQSLEHLHSNELIMTIGRSRTVEAFLKQAAKLRKFHVIVAECAPYFQGHEMALSLGSVGIETTVITDSAIFAIMSRVNKVMIGATAVMADGGLIATTGSHSLALAAKFHSVSVIVCASMSKLCPRYLSSYDQDRFNTLVSPNDTLDYSDAELAGRVQCLQPMFDYVPPELVNLFISNLGGHAPSYVYRLLSDYYHEDDFEL
eukprot:m.63926 g.63926  ORF g.63926 m.63926 type:complete len:348 (+) comp13892_c0_seq2:85-1128(+)